MLLMRRTDRVGFSFLDGNGESNGGNGGNGDNGNNGSFVKPPIITPRLITPRIIGRPPTNRIDPDRDLVLDPEVRKFKDIGILVSAERIVGKSRQILGDEAIDPLRKKTLTKTETVEKQSNLMTFGVLAGIALLLFN